MALERGLPITPVAADFGMHPEAQRHGNSAIKLAQINRYAAERLALFIGKRHKRGRRIGWARLVAAPAAWG